MAKRLHEVEGSDGVLDQGAWVLHGTASGFCSTLAGRISRRHGEMKVAQ